jgi:hypothetical protein
MCRVRAVTFDAMNTLIRPRHPIASTYKQLACAHGVHVDGERVRTAFVKHYTHMNDASPCFGHTAGGGRVRDTAQTWWSSVVMATVRDAVVE